MPAFERLCPGGRSKRQTQKGRERHEHMKVKIFGRDSFSVDRETVDIRYVEQLADSEQTCGLAYLMRYVLENPEGSRTVRQAESLLSGLLERKGWEPFCGSYVPCGLAKPRKQEIYAVLNRYRGISE